MWYYHAREFIHVYGITVRIFRRIPLYNVCFVFVYLIPILGPKMIDPKTSYHLNDIFEYPDRITISTESSDVLQSR